MMTRPLTTIFLFLSFAAPSIAQTMDATRYEKEETPFITRVSLNASTCAAVSDAIDVLAIGQHEGESDITLYKLDGRGVPVASTLATVTLPRPAALPKDRDNEPKFLLFHPKLPILYVWQDSERPRDDPAKHTAAYHAIQHVLVYRIDGAKVTLAQGFTLDDGVQSGRTLGEMALDADGKRLYVGNLVEPRINKRNGDEKLVEGVGYLEVNADGLIATEGKEPKLHATYSTTLPSGPHCGGFVPISDDIVIVSGQYGPITWNLTDIRERFLSIFSWPPRYYKRIAGHPTLPAVYVSCYAQAYIYSHQHVDGHITLMPKISSVSGPYTAPVVMTGQKGVAFGGSNALTVYDIDDLGQFTGDWYSVAVNRKEVKAVTYSQKFDRLYIGEDVK